MYDDYTEDDRWDWDRYDPRQYCRHGSFIGSFWGPDILCGDCESSCEDPSLRDMVDDVNIKINKIHSEFDGMMTFINLYSKSLGGDVKDPALTEAMLETMKSLNQRRDALETNRKILIEKYEPFCENGDWNDTGILYKHHRHMIDEFDKERLSHNG